MPESLPNQNKVEFKKEIEREVKVVELGQLADYGKFKEKVEFLGGKLAEGTQELYLIDDLRLKLKPDSQILSETTLDAGRFGDKEKVVRAMALLSFVLESEKENFLVFREKNKPELRTVRIRKEGDDVFFGVKEKELLTLSH